MPRAAPPAPAPSPSPAPSRAPPGPSCEAPPAVRADPAGRAADAGPPRRGAQTFHAESFTLDNGLQVVVLPNHRVPVVTHMVWYKVGAADEPPGSSGIAHLLEHLMFKGTDTIAPGQFSRIIARNGGRDNAFTSSDYTGYYQTIARDRLELVMEMEADRMANLRLGRGRRADRTGRGDRGTPQPDRQRTRGPAEERLEPGPVGGASLQEPDHRLGARVAALTAPTRWPSTIASTPPTTPSWWWPATSPPRTCVLWPSAPMARSGRRPRRRRATRVRDLPPPVDITMTLRHPRSDRPVGGARSWRRRATSATPTLYPALQVLAETAGRQSRSAACMTAGGRRTGSPCPPAPAIAGARWITVPSFSVRHAGRGYTPGRGRRGRRGRNRPPAGRRRDR